MMRGMRRAGDAAAAAAARRSCSTRPTATTPPDRLPADRPTRCLRPQRRFVNKVDSSQTSEGLVGVARHSHIESAVRQYKRQRQVHVIIV